MYKEEVLGFDCRPIRLPDVGTWPISRISELIKPDVEQVLTVNRCDWKSVFLPEHSQKAGEWEGTVSGSRLQVPREYWATQWYWRDFEAMRTYLTQHKGEVQHQCWLIAITIVYTPRYEEQSRIPMNQDSYRYVPFVSVTDPEVNDEWVRLGYDAQDGVMDGSEGLGIVYPHLQDEMRERWGTHLNKYHLFDDQEQAVQYADWQDATEPAIGPMFVYGLYLIQPFPA